MRHLAAAGAILLGLTAIPASASCLVAGDCIALGTGQALRVCTVDAKVGASSAAIVRRVRPGFDLTLISAGSNDPHNPRLAANLRAMRARATGAVTWIAPVDATAATAVRSVAAERGDRVVGFAPGRDHVHPHSYGALARLILTTTRP